MATITRHVCDRCEKDLSYHGKTSIIRKKPQKFKIVYLWNGNPSGYDYTEQVAELCPDCTEKLQNFLDNKAGAE